MNGWVMDGVIWDGVYYGCMVEWRDSLFGAYCNCNCNCEEARIDGSLREDTVPGKQCLSWV
jgi:NDP-sugar pyrophosphorylase family protein